MFYGAMIIMNNSEKFFLNGDLGYALSDAEKWIEERFLTKSFARCVNAENEPAYINISFITSIEIIEWHKLDEIRKEIIENKKFSAENILKCIGGLYKD